MEEKQGIKISLSTFFLILAIITIVIMGIFIYKYNNDKASAIKKSNELQSQVNSLNGYINDLQNKINTISETINSDENNKKEISKKDETATQNSEANSTNNSTNNSTTISKVDSTKELYYYSSGDNAAAHGNPELLYVYEVTNKKMKFKYHTPWNEVDIEGIATSIDGEKYIHEFENKKLEILLNSMGENSVKVTEYENGNEQSFKNLFK